MSSVRYLIVNADDFGQSAGINRGIIEAHERGIVTSASLMVRWPAVLEAADYSRTHPELSVGLHLDLCEWIYRDDNWLPLYEVVPAADAGAVEQEVTRQLGTFRKIIGRNPTHLDSHQHVHRSEPVRSIMTKTARRLGIPLRDCDDTIKYCGNFYGQSANGFPHPEGISVEGLIETLKKLSPGVTEIGCHPGFGRDAGTMYSHERDIEVQALCDARVRAVIEDEEIALRSFLNVNGSETRNNLRPKPGRCAK